MPKFRVDPSFDENSAEEIPFREVDLPFDRTAFTTALLDLEEEVFQEYGDNRTIHTSVISALEDISTPSIKPDASPIKKGDVVWRNWDDFVTPAIFEDGIKLYGVLEEYKPLWEFGPGYLALIEIFNKDDWE
jgi:hypothetical protein